MVIKANNVFTIHLPQNKFKRRSVIFISNSNLFICLMSYKPFLNMKDIYFLNYSAFKNVAKAPMTRYRIIFCFTLHMKIHKMKL